MAIKLVVDTPNLLFRVASQNMKVNFGTDEEKAGLALHMAFQTVHKYFKIFKPDLLACVFEGGQNWRKTYTRSDACVSGNIYKANRVKDASMEPYFAMMDSFRDVMTKHSSVMCLRNELCEGDDMISAFVQAYANGDDEIIIVSGDRDFVQLLKFPNVRLINPDTGKDRNRPDDKEYYPDLDYFIFKKCIRGDTGDYVFSAFPKVRETKIIKAYEDEKYRAEFMRETWKSVNEDGTEKINVVGELFEENKLLMDLTLQPDEIKLEMFNTVLNAYDNIGEYSNFHFLKFLGTHKLNNLAQNIDQFTNMMCVNTVYKKKIADGVPIGKPKKNLIEF